MTAEGRVEQLLGCLVQVIGRAALKEDFVREIVGTGSKQLRAFNLCDGTRTQTDIRKKVGLDAGNFSRTARRWIEQGVVFEIADGGEAKLLHVYPLGKPQKAKGARAPRKR
jgi:hypothetical protein